MLSYFIFSSVDVFFIIEVFWEVKRWIINRVYWKYLFTWFYAECSHLRMVGRYCIAYTSSSSREAMIVSPSSDIIMEEVKRIGSLTNKTIFPEHLLCCVVHENRKVDFQIPEHWYHHYILNAQSLIVKSWERIYSDFSIIAIFQFFKL